MTFRVGPAAVAAAGGGLVRASSPGSAQLAVPRTTAGRRSGRGTDARGARDGRSPVTPCMVEREIHALRSGGAMLEKAGTVAMTNGPAGVATARP